MIFLRLFMTKKIKYEKWHGFEFTSGPPKNINDIENGVILGKECF